MKSGLSKWVGLNLLFAACLMAARLLFFLELHFRIGLEWTAFPTVVSGYLFDFLLLCRVFVFGLIPFVLLHRFLPKLASALFLCLLVLYVVVSALLAEYYCNLGMPLDHVVLVYTPQELRETVFSSSVAVSFSQVMWFLLHLAAAVALLLCFRRLLRTERSLWLSAAMVLTCLLVTILVRYPQLVRDERFYSSHNRFCLAVNQPTYSWIKITDYRNELKGDRGETYSKSVNETVEAYQALHPEFEYDQPGYPFYRVANDPDVLGPMLRGTSDGLPPNLVFVIVEGLGRRLTGVVNPILSFTPFLDSLASEGLFWPNCFSTSERTFGVLPSVFASAPHGRLGFVSSLPYLPLHRSLLLDLEENGYRTAFYYGGDPSFDRYDLFMKGNGIGYLFEPNLMVADSAQYRLLSSNNRWGLDDDQLFDCAIRHKQANPTAERPFADIYLTLSTHEPFVVDSLETYEKQVRKMLDQAKGMTQRERDNITKNLNIYACFLYLDNSLRALFDYYASRDDFANTVFVITGDHRMAPIPFGVPIRKYNVPLVVYSPLVKQSKTMNAIVSHLDIAPSLDAYLQANYDYAIPDHCHWLGTSFDTVAEFRNTRKLAFMLNNRDVVDYVDGNYLINHNTMMRFDDNLVGTAVEDGERYRRMKEELEDFQYLSRFVVQHDFLMPEPNCSVPK